MALLSYTALTKGLKVNGETDSFVFNGKKVEFLKYLPVMEQFKLIHLSIEGAKTEEGLYDPIILDWRFHLNLIYAHCLIRFTDKQKEDEAKLYDVLESNGFIETFLAAFDEKIYNQYQDYLNQIIKNKVAYEESLGKAIKSLTVDLPAVTDEAAEILESFDEEQFENIIQLANDVRGGGKEIPKTMLPLKVVENDEDDEEE